MFTFRRCRQFLSSVCDRTKRRPSLAVQSSFGQLGVLWLLGRSSGKTILHCVPLTGTHFTFCALSVWSDLLRKLLGVLWSVVFDTKRYQFWTLYCAAPTSSLQRAGYYTARFKAGCQPLGFGNYSNFLGMDLAKQTFAENSRFPLTCLSLGHFWHTYQNILDSPSTSASNKQLQSHATKEESSAPNKTRSECLVHRCNLHNLQHPSITHHGVSFRWRTSRQF